MHLFVNGCINIYPKTVTKHECVHSYTVYTVCNIVILQLVSVKWLAFLLHIWEVLGLNLGGETEYFNEGFSWFYSVPVGKFQNRTTN
jgi:hypothetical protein